MNTEIKKKLTPQLKELLKDYAQAIIDMEEKKTLLKNQSEKEKVNFAILNNEIQNLIDLYIKYIKTKTPAIKQEIDTLKKKFHYIGDIYKHLLVNKTFKEDVEALQKWLKQFEEYSHLTKAEIPYLEELDLYSNDKKISSLPKEIKCLKKLKELWVWNNDISYLPEEIKYLTNLQKINLSWNKLAIFPKVILELKNLRNLDLGNNKLMSIPKEIKTLKKLKLLAIEGNNLSSIPREIKDLPDLFELRLRNNNLSSIPIDIVKKFRGLHIDLRDNNLSAEEIKRLKYVDTDKNFPKLIIK